MTVTKDELHDEHRNGSGGRSDGMLAKQMIPPGKEQRKRKGTRTGKLASVPVNL